MVVPKGSVTLDGVSLTVSALSDGERFFEVNLIPTTWAETSLSERRVGDGLNLETDLLGKYVDRLLRRAPPSSGITLETLAAAGFPVAQSFPCPRKTLFLRHLRGTVENPPRVPGRGLFPRPRNSPRTRKASPRWRNLRSMAANPSSPKA